MDDIIIAAISDMLKSKGYAEVEANSDTVWYRGTDGKMYAISAIECQDDYTDGYGETGNE
ncbi:MAG: hypothetical protein ACI4CE_07420 [Methanomethylophilus alvi]